jgi:hypothetical protein
MDDALNKKGTALEIAQSSSVEDTVHTLIFKQEKGELTVAINVANGYSADALNESGRLQYTNISLTKLFDDFLKKAKQIDCKTTVYPLTQEEPYLSMLSCVDLEGCRNVQTGRVLSKLYSDLMLDAVRESTTKHAYYPEAHRKQIMYSTIGIFHELRMATNQSDYKKHIRNYQGFMGAIESHAARNQLSWQLLYLTGGAFLLTGVDIATTYMTGGSSLLLRLLTAIGAACIEWPSMSAIAGTIVAVTSRKAYQWYTQPFYSNLVTAIEKEQPEKNMTVSPRKA